MGEADTTPIRVMQVIDSLATGGAERMAVTLANELVGVVDGSALCATRAMGPLLDSVSQEVDASCLHRQGRLGVRSARALRSLVREERIDVVHAHGSSIYFTAIALAGPRRPALVWHDHNSRLAERSPRLARAGSALADRVFAVSEDVRDWQVAGGTPPERIEVFPNFVTIDDAVSPASGLPGVPGERVVVVGNLRPEKNHVGTVRAFARVAATRPSAHLLFVGSTANHDVTADVQRTAADLGVAERVSLLGVRTDVAEVLAACDVGVLFSHAEGFPIALLEYGRASLPAVASGVGHVRAVAELTDGVVIVPPDDEAALADELERLLQDRERCQARGRDFRGAVEHHFSSRVVVPTVVERYRALALDRREPRGWVSRIPRRRA